MTNIESIPVGREGETTRFLVEARPEGMWSGDAEISIAHELNGKRSQFAPSIPLEAVPDLIHALLHQYTKLMQLKNQG